MTRISVDMLDRALKELTLTIEARIKAKKAERNASSEDRGLLGKDSIWDSINRRIKNFIQR